LTTRTDAATIRQGDILIISNLFEGIRDNRIKVQKSKNG